MIHIYHGEGKGKTTAALGLVVRAAGNDYNIIIAQFLKARDVGELKTLAQISGVTLLRADITDTFSYRMTVEEKTQAYQAHNKLFQQAILLCGRGEKNLLILDEIIGTVNEKLIDHEKVLDFLRQPNANLEIVLTGRDPDSDFLALGDYITEMKKIKHPYDHGVKMRKGIEY